MSWDVYLIRTKTNTEPYDQEAKEDIIPFTRKEIVDEIVSLAQDLGLRAEDLDARFPYLRGDGWSIKICFWYEEPYETVDLQVRGIYSPTEVFTRLKKDLNARLFDMHGGKFIEDEVESGFEEWKDFTAKVVEDLTIKETQNLSHVGDKNGG